MDKLHCSDTLDYIQLEVPEEEDLAEFPPNPPNSPVTPPAKESPIKITKLAFRDKINFIIPKLKNRSDYTGKTCLKHHSILCKVCPLIKRAKNYKVQRNLVHTALNNGNNIVGDQYHVADPKTLSTTRLLGNPNCQNNPVGDPYTVTDPKISRTTCSVGDPCHNKQDLGSDLQIPSGAEATTRSETPIQIPQSAQKGARYTVCPSCSHCCCPRGSSTYRTKKRLSRARQARRSRIPSLLDLPVVVPPKYRTNPMRFHWVKVVPK